MRKDSISIAIIKGGKRGKCISVYARFDWFPELSSKILTATEEARTVYYRISKRGRIEICRAKAAIELIRPSKLAQWHRGTFVDVHPHRNDKYRPLELLIPLKKVGLATLPYRDRVPVTALGVGYGARWSIWRFRKTIFTFLDISEYTEIVRCKGRDRAARLSIKVQQEKHALIRIKRHIDWINKILEEHFPAA